jgi:hypothetical protein
MWTPDEVQRIMMNPFYAIKIHPILTQEHPPLVDEEMWIQTNIRLIKEVGAENYVRVLLDILKKGK